MKVPGRRSRVVAVVALAVALPLKSISDASLCLQEGEGRGVRVSIDRLSVGSSR